MQNSETGQFSAQGPDFDRSSVLPSPEFSCHLVVLAIQYSLAYVRSKLSCVFMDDPIRLQKPLSMLRYVLHIAEFLFLLVLSSDFFIRVVSCLRAALCCVCSIEHGGLAFHDAALPLGTHNADELSPISPNRCLPSIQRVL